MTFVTVGFQDSHALITLDRPEALNALHAPLLDELDAALDQVEGNAATGVVILWGGPKIFSVGGDLKEDHDDADIRIARMHRLALRLKAYSRITIAAIEGWALGGGLEIALGCTFRVAAPDARMGMPEIRMGLIPGFGGTQLLPRLIGSARACAMLCDGEAVDAARALEIGLIDSIAPETGTALAHAREYARRFSGHPRQAQHAARLAVEEGLNLPLEDALEIERRHLKSLRGSAYVPEGIMKFRQAQQNRN